MRLLKLIQGIFKTFMENVIVKKLYTDFKNIFAQK